MNKGTSLSPLISQKKQKKTTDTVISSFVDWMCISEEKFREHELCMQKNASTGSQPQKIYGSQKWFSLSDIVELF